jgi:hypothetical protein
MRDQYLIGSEFSGAGFAVRCDPAGVVQALLLQDGEPCGSVRVGGSLQDSVDPDSRSKLERFLAEGQGAAPAIGWELNLPYSAGLRALLFAAVRARGGLIVAAATGLGLAAARATLAAHGGHMEIESAPGAGTTVTIILPAAAERA